MLTSDYAGPLDQLGHPRWYLHRSHPSDGAPEWLGSKPPRSRTTGTLDVSGLDRPPANLEALLAVDPQSSLAEMEQNEVFLGKLGDRLPRPPCYERDCLVTSIASDP